MLKNYLFVLIFLWAGSAFTQSHLNYRYVIEAGVFRDDSLTYFIVHEYPVFEAHPNDTAAILLETRFREGYRLKAFQDTNRFEALTALPAISDDAFLGPDALLELLRNRLGMSKANFAATPHEVDMHIHSVGFPDDREPFFNHQHLHATRSNGMKRFKQNQHDQAVDWSNGEALTLGSLGGASSKPCLIKAIEQLDLEDDACQGRALEKQLDDTSFCDWPIRTIASSYIRLNVTQIDFACKPEEEGDIEIERACLDEEGGCE